MTVQAAIRYLGLVLQLVGFGTITWNLIDLRRRFSDEPSLLTAIGMRLRRARARAGVLGRRLLGRPRPPAVHSLSASDSALAGDAASVSVAHGEINADLPVREQVRLLDQRTRALRQDFDRLQQETRDEAVAREQVDADERAARTAADEGLDKRIGDLAVGGLRVQRFGVAAFVAGVTLATVPDEVASLLRWIFG